MLLQQYSHLEFIKQSAFAVIVVGLELVGALLQGDHPLTIAPHFSFGFASAVLLCYSWRYAFGLVAGSTLILLIRLSDYALLFPALPTTQSLANFFSTLLLATAFFLLRKFLSDFQGIRTTKIFLRIVSICALTSLLNPITQLGLFSHNTTMNLTLAIDQFILNWFAEFNACLLFLPIINEIRFYPKKVTSQIAKNASITHSPFFTSLIFASALVLGQVVFFHWFNDFIGDIAKPFWLILLLSIAALKSDTYIVLLLLICNAIQVIVSMIWQYGFFIEVNLYDMLITAHIYLLTSSLSTLLIAYFLRETHEFTVSMQAIISQMKLKEETLDTVSLGVAVNDENNKLACTSSVFQSIEQYKDQLTGLANTAGLQQAIQQYFSDIARPSIEAHSAALFALNIDHFKHINDTISYSTGDVLLMALAKRLSGIASDNATLCRQNGDEFKLFIPNITRPQTNELAQKILLELSKPFEVNEHTLSVTCSLGIALYPDDGKTPDELLRSADIALHQAKISGKRRHLFHTQSMTDALDERIALEQQLPLAAQQGEFRLFYQAIVNVKTGSINGFEALIRWQHPQLGWISPERFIPLAEKNGTISIIGEWVFNQACSDIRSAINAELSLFPVAINMSPKQFQNKKIIRDLQDTLNKYQLTPAHFCIEITEGVLMDDPVVSQTTLLELRDLGFHLSLDDFGTGYSSLSYLSTFSFDKVKIDQSFICRLTTKSQDAAIVVAIINMAHNLGLKVLAEGVETEAQCEFLRNNLIDEIQGYMFSKPLPWDQTLALLQENRQLPAHLLRFPETTKTLLLVDDEQNIVSALKRLVRRDGYQILIANSGTDALDILEKNTVDVIISDQRMPGMTGVEFLSIVKERYPDTIRLMLSGYTELKSVVDAINEGSVFRFLTKPWDDDKLRACIKDAFQYKNYADYNQQLSLKAQASSFELAQANRQLAELIDKKQNQLTIHLQSLEIVREALRHTSVALLGLDDTPIVAFINESAIELFSCINLNFGDELQFACPELYELIMSAEESIAVPFYFNTNTYIVRWHNLGNDLTSNGKIVTMAPQMKSSIR
jgi:diguanylate cyclase (GGDEF)-like protein